MSHLRRDIFPCPESHLSKEEAKNSPCLLPCKLVVQSGDPILEDLEFFFFFCGGGNFLLTSNVYLYIMLQKSSREILLGKSLSPNIYPLDF